MTKNEIINQFLEDKSDSLPCANMDIFQTTFGELSAIYDLIKLAIESETPWQDFLQLEKATNRNGDVVKDREVNYYDKEKKQNVSTKIVFKYFVYNYFKKKIEQQEEQLNYVQEMSWEEMNRGFEGLINIAKKTSHIEAMARGFKKAKEKFESSEKIDTLLEIARKKYVAIKI